MESGRVVGRAGPCEVVGCTVEWDLNWVRGRFRELWISVRVYVGCSCGWNRSVW
jgi:hypothetical protein